MARVRDVPRVFRRRHTIIAWGLAIALAVLWLWDVGVGPARRWEIGTVSEGAGAFATAAGVAYLAYERGQTLRADRLAREEEQARLVTAWCYDVEESPGHPKWNLPGATALTFRIAVHNGSDLAVHSVMASVGQHFPYEKEAGASGGWFIGSSAERWTVLEPYQTTRAEIHTVREPDEDWPFPPPIKVSFVDAAGRPWSRISGEQLERLPSHFRHSMGRFARAAPPPSNEGAENQEADDSPRFGGDAEVVTFSFEGPLVTGMTSGAVVIGDEGSVPAQDEDGEEPAGDGR